jgi:L-cystine transport system substrate-binding protein
MALSRRNFLKISAAALATGAASASLVGCSGSGGGSGEAAAGAEDAIIYVGTQNDYPPFTFYELDGTLTGLDIEFIRALDERLEGYTIEINDAGWDSAFIGLDAGRIDAIIDQVAVNAEREEIYLFTIPYFTALSVIIVKGGNPLGIQTLDDLQGLTVGTNEGDSYSMLLNAYNAAHGPDEQIKLIYWNAISTPESLQELDKGAADAFVNDPVMANAIIKELNLDLEIVGEPLLTDPIAVLLPKNEHGEELKALLDPIIEELIADGTLAQLSQEFTEADYVPRR